VGTGVHQSTVGRESNEEQKLQPLAVSERLRTQLRRDRKVLPKKKALATRHATEKERSLDHFYSGGEPRLIS